MANTGLSLHAVDVEKAQCQPVGCPHVAVFFFRTSQDQLLVFLHSKLREIEPPEECLARQVFGFGFVPMSPGLSSLDCFIWVAFDLVC